MKVKNLPQIARKYGISVLFNRTSFVEQQFWVHTQLNGSSTSRVYAVPRRVPTTLSSRRLDVGCRGNIVILVRASRLRDVRRPCSHSSYVDLAMHSTQNNLDGINRLKSFKRPTTVALLNSNKFVSQNYIRSEDIQLVIFI
jgi:hypothetical protein